MSDKSKAERRPFIRAVRHMSDHAVQPQSNSSGSSGSITADSKMSIEPMPPAGPPAANFFGSGGRGQPVSLSGRTMSAPVRVPPTPVMDYGKASTGSENKSSSAGPSQPAAMEYGDFRDTRELDDDEEGHEHKDTDEAKDVGENDDMDGEPVAPVADYNMPMSASQPASSYVPLPGFLAKLQAHQRGEFKGNPEYESKLVKTDSMLCGLEQAIASMSIRGESESANLSSGSASSDDKKSSTLTTIQEKEEHFPTVFSPRGTT